MNGAFVDVTAWLNELEGWLGAHSDLASWLQAAGVLIALALAISIPARQHRRDSSERRRERQAEAVTLAIAIHPELSALATGVAPAIGRIQALAEDLKQGRPRVPIAMGAGYFSIGEAPVLRSSVLRLHVLGTEAGAAAQQVAAWLAQYERLAMDVEGRINQAIHGRDTEYPGLKGLLAAIEALTQPLKRALEKVKALP
jgi:hypothetical protein